MAEPVLPKLSCRHPLARPWGPDGWVDQAGREWMVCPTCNATWPEPYREVREAPEGTYTEVWECEPPPVGVPYRVLDQEWSDDYTVRTIRRVHLLDASAQPDGEST